MTSEPTDDDILAGLRRAAASIDPLPEHVAAAARAALATRRLDDELAELTLDSALAGAAVRSDDDVRVLSYRAEGVTLELQLEHGSPLRGLATGTTGQAVVETRDATREVMVGADGLFSVPGLPGGPLRVRVRTADGRRVVTPWVTV